MPADWNHVIERLSAGRIDVVWSRPDGGVTVEPPPAPFGLLSGSFNPLHEGHRTLRAAAEQHLRHPVHFELPIQNADKPPLDPEAIEHRRRQFRDFHLALSRAATFAEKAAVFPETVFVVGADTAERIVEPRFYGGTAEAMHGSLAQIQSAGCRFLVAGRQQSTRFLTLADIPLPRGTEDLFLELPATLFRMDVSSTNLRSQNNR